MYIYIFIFISINIYIYVYIQHSSGFISSPAQSILSSPPLVANAIILHGNAGPVSSSAGIGISWLYEVSTIGAPQQKGCFIKENPIKIDDLGYILFVLIIFSSGIWGVPGY